MQLPRLRYDRLAWMMFLLIVVMIFKPSGLMGTYDFSLGRMLEKLLNGGGKALFRKKADQERKAGDAE